MFNRSQEDSGDAQKINVILVTSMEYILHVQSETSFLFSIHQNLLRIESTDHSFGHYILRGNRLQLDRRISSGVLHSRVIRINYMHIFQNSQKKATSSGAYL